MRYLKLRFTIILRSSLSLPEYNEAVTRVFGAGYLRFI
jgi:hypothetical protein